MATNPLHKFTVAESNNLQVYENYSSHQINCADIDTYVESTDWAGGSDGKAKQVLIVPYTGDAAGVLTITQAATNGGWGAIGSSVMFYCKTDGQWLVRVDSISTGTGATGTIAFS